MHFVSPMNLQVQTLQLKPQNLKPSTRSHAKSHEPPSTLIEPL